MSYIVHIYACARELYSFVHDHRQRWLSIHRSITSHSHILLFKDCSWFNQGHLTLTCGQVRFHSHYRARDWNDTTFTIATTAVARNAFGPLDRLLDCRNTWRGRGRHAEFAQSLIKGSEKAGYKRLDCKILALSTSTSSESCTYIGILYVSCIMRPSLTSTDK